MLVLVVLSPITKKGEIVRKWPKGHLTTKFWCLMNNITIWTKLFANVFIIVQKMQHELGRRQTGY